MSMMKDMESKYILYSVYHDLSLEERSREVYLALTQISNYQVIVNSLGKFSSISNNDDFKFVPKKNKIFGMLRLINFWKLTKRLLRQYNPKVVVLHDDAVLVRYIKRNYPDIKIVYDQSELEIDRKISGIKTLFLKLCDLFGKNAVKLCDLFITANEERAKISKQYYNFECNYIVFNNMHKIAENEIGREFEEKYSHVFSKRVDVIVYGGGIAKDRGTFDLIDAVKMDKDKYLIIAGAAWKNLSIFQDKLRRENIDNVEYVGFVSRREWAYILSKSSASVVYYDKTISLNFKYCASGKGYESLFLGVPIICSDNPPLVSLCEEYKCGVCGDNMRVATKSLFTQYDYYKENAKVFSGLVDYDSRIPNLSQQIVYELRL